jgi:cell division protein FtsB
MFLFIIKILLAIISPCIVVGVTAWICFLLIQPKDKNKETIKSLKNENDRMRKELKAMKKGVPLDISEKINEIGG